MLRDAAADCQIEFSNNTGREETRELMVYKADDMHLEISSVHGEVVITVGLTGRALEWRGTLDTYSDLKNFCAPYQRELLENGKVIRIKQWQTSVPRDGL